MTRITWDGNKNYFQGVSNGVLYPQNSPGVAWSGLISVVEKGDEAGTSYFIDGQTVLNRVAPTDFSATLNAFTYPDEFERYNGVYLGYTAQPRLTFGLSYSDNQELHIVYNAIIAPSNDQYETLSDSPSLVAFSWPITTMAVDIPDARPTAHLIINIAEASPAAMTLLEAALYGDDENDPYLPPPADIIEMFESSATVRITDNGNGTWSATGPDDAVYMIDGSTFGINWPSAIFLDDSTYQVSSL